MRFQFYRLYLLIIIAASLIILSFDEIIDSVAADQQGYEIDVDYLLQAFEHRASTSEQHTVPMPMFGYIDKSSLALPSELEQVLNKGKTIALANDQQYTYYYKLTDTTDQVLKFGPVLEESDSRDTMLYLGLLFYGCLAILLLFFMRPMFRDLASLQQDANTFGRQATAMQSDIKSTSSIYPLALAFNRMSSKIVDFIEMNKDLSRAISHEIRTPLARMKFMLAIVADKLEPQQQQQVSSDIREIELLVNDYLSFSKIESQFFAERVQAHSPKAFLKVVKRKFALYEDEIDIQCRFSDDKAWFNKQAIGLATQNLLTNALRYASNTIRICFECNEQHCYLIVEDDGPGIGCDDKEQGNNELISKQGGHQSFGLGLYLVKKIAILHEGKFLLSRSEELGGAKMVLSWPNQKL